MMKRFTLAISAMSLFVAASASATPASPAGDWVTDGGQSIVRFSPCGAGWCGHIDRVLRPEPGAPARDVHNPEPSLRSRAILGMRIVELNRVAGDRWKGTIYDPRSGKSYTALVRRLAGNQLEVQGCLAIFCRTLRWTAQ
jgi:uncharacterized protein (DUF2147 family)